MFDIESLSISLNVKSLLFSSVPPVQLTGTKTPNASTAIGAKIFNLQEITQIRNKYGEKQITGTCKVNRHRKIYEQRYTKSYSRSSENDPKLLRTATVRVLFHTL